MNMTYAKGHAPKSANTLPPPKKRRGVLEFRAYHTRARRHRLNRGRRTVEQNRAAR